jgi:hypothetical protein
MKVLQEYECACGFAPSVAVDTADAALEMPAADTELAVNVSVPPLSSDSQEVSLSQPTKAAKTIAVVAATNAVEVVVGEARPSSSHPVAAEVVKARVPDEPTAAIQERVAPEATTRAASPDIWEAEETEASLSQGAAGGEAQILEPAPLGRPLLGSATTPRTTRRLRRATTCSVG